MAWPTTIASATAGGIGASSDFNNHRDALSAVGGPASTYTPTLTSTTNPTLGASSLAGRYRKLGNWADIHISLTIGAGFSPGSGGYIFSLPPGMSIFNAGASEALGYGTARDVAPSPTSRTFLVYYVSSTSVAMVNTDGTGALLGATAPFTWATGDRITLHIPALELA
jgi:hypothetical protein